MKKAISFLIITLAFFTGCKKTVEWNVSLTILTEVRNVSLRSAQCVGLISVNRGGALKQMGFCWNTTGAPTIDDNVLITPTFSDTSSAKYFDIFLDELTPGTTYYMRAYAENADGVGYGNEVSFTTQSPANIKVGQWLQGGYIFYVDPTGEHGLICAPSDIDYTDWGCNSNVTTSSEVGSGLSNSLAIDKECPSSSASKCLLYKGIEGEWYLPSIDEWKLIYENLVLGKFWSAKSSADYWTSTQANASSAFTMSFSNSLSAQPASQPKYLGAYVLPIKEF